MARLSSLGATAHHEAGHAVAAWHYGMRFKYVTIEADRENQSLGHLMHQMPKWFHPDYDSSDRVVLRAQRHIIVSFAGQLAEQKFRGRKPRYGMQSDDRKAVDLAFYLCGSEDTVNAYLRFCWLASRDVVNVRWPEIKAVAQGLLSRQTLQYDDVLEIISPGALELRQLLRKKATA
jgi:hypothetical protein